MIPLKKKNKIKYLYFVSVDKELLTVDVSVKQLCGETSLIILVIKIFLTKIIYGLCSLKVL